jgi:hypothetical protein
MPHQVVCTGTVARGYKAFTLALPTLLLSATGHCLSALTRLSGSPWLPISLRGWSRVDRPNRHPSLPTRIVIPAFTVLRYNLKGDSYLKDMDSLQDHYSILQSARTSPFSIFLDHRIDSETSNAF